MLQQAVDEKFMREVHQNMWVVVDAVEDILNALEYSKSNWDGNARKFAAI